MILQKHIPHTIYSDTLLEHELDTHSEKAQLMALWPVGLKHN